MATQTTALASPSSLRATRRMLQNARRLTGAVPPAHAARPGDVTSVRRTRRQGALPRAADTVQDFLADLAMKLTIGDETIRGSENLLRAESLRDQDCVPTHSPSGE